MRRLLYAITLVAATLPASTAHADPNNLTASGLTCGFMTSNDPSGTVANPGTQVGYTTAGPTVVTGLVGIDGSTTPPTIDLSPVADNPASGELICDVQVGGTGHFSEADASHVVSGRGTVVPYMPPTLISYAAAATDAVWSCTTLRLYDAAGSYVNLYADSVTGEFSTDATTATCDLAISQGLPPQEVCDLAQAVCDLPVRRSGGRGDEKASPQQPYVCASGPDSVACVYY